MPKKKINWRSVTSLRTIIYTVIGVLLAVVGLQGFMVPNNFLDGGVTGISILVRGLSDIHIGLLLVIFNIPFLILGFQKLGYTFGIQSLFAVILLALGMMWVEIPAFTEDKVLIAVFGGLFIGLGIGFVIRGGGVIDGLEVIGQYTEKKSAFTSGEIILVLNILIILGAAFRFGIETAMYSILVYFTAMKTTNYVVDGFEEFTAMYVVSGKSEEIKQLIKGDFRKGMTVFKGERAHLPDGVSVPVDCDILMVLVTRLELYRLEESVQRIDPKAFVYVHGIKEVRGGLLSKRNANEID